MDSSDVDFWLTYCPSKFLAFLEVRIPRRRGVNAPCGYLRLAVRQRMREASPIEDGRTADGPNRRRWAVHTGTTAMTAPTSRRPVL